MLIQSRNMNRCDMGNLSTWPGAVVGQKRAAQLSLKLKSSPEWLCRWPQRSHLFFKHGGFKVKFSSFSLSPSISLCLSEIRKKANIMDEHFYIADQKACKCFWPLTYVTVNAPLRLSDVFKVKCSACFYLFLPCQLEDLSKPHVDRTKLSTWCFEYLVYT